jgi:hypothetical protein
MNLSPHRHDFNPKTENHEVEDVMSKGSLRGGTIGATALMGAAILCLGSVPAMADTRQVLTAGMSAWGAAGAMIIGSMAALTCAELVATMLRKAGQSLTTLRAALRFRGLAYKS